MDEEAPNVGKTRLTITEAALHAWLNRTYFYQKYITPWLITPKVDERWKKYIELDELILVTGPLPPPKTAQQQTLRQQEPTIHNKQTDNTDGVDAKILQAKIEGLEAALKMKDQIVRIQEQQLSETVEREKFLREELRTMRYLAAPALKKTEEEKEKLSKKRRWFWPFR